MLTKANQRWLWIALVFASLVKLYFTVFTHGSVDVDGFRDHFDKIQEFGVGAYRIRGAFNNPFNSPPPMIHVIKLWGWLTSVTGLHFGFWLRLPSILADIGSFVIVSRFLAKLWPDKNHFWPLLAMALCPTAILISGYHGNTDLVMIFLVLLAIYLIEKPWAGMIFGLALCVKILPLAFAPAIVFYLPWKKSFVFFSEAVAVFTLCSMPYLIQDPAAVCATVFGYGSIYGKWGFTLIAALFFPDPPTYLHGQFDVQGSHLIFASILKLVLVAAIVLASFRFRKNPYVSCGVVTATLLFFAPGFGSQYLVWPIPFVPVLGLRSLTYYFMSGFYSIVVYSCVGLLLCPTPGRNVLASLLCWLSVLMILLGYLKIDQVQLRRTQPESAVDIVNDGRSVA